MTEENKVGIVWLFEDEEGLWVANDDVEDRMVKLHSTREGAVHAINKVALNGDEPREFVVIPVEEYRRLKELDVEIYTDERIAEFTEEVRKIGGGPKE